MLRHKCRILKVVGVTTQAVLHRRGSRLIRAPIDNRRSREDCGAEYSGDHWRRDGGYWQVLIRAYVCTRALWSETLIEIMIHNCDVHTRINSRPSRLHMKIEGCGR